MAISALDMMTSATDRQAFYMGLGGFILIVAKGSFEAVSGKVMLSFLHFGLMGSPVAVSHAGGILGVLLAFALLNRLDAFGKRRS